jgi:predicted ester cyclase
MGKLGDSILKQLKLIDAHDFDGAAKGETEDSEYRTPFMDVTGGDSIRMAREVLANAFPDARHNIKNVVESDDSVAVEVLWTGTHTGPLATPMGDIPPSGNPAEIPMLYIAKVEQGGQISSTHIYYDQVGLMMAMGLFPAPATA